MSGAGTNLEACNFSMLVLDIWHPQTYVTIRGLRGSLPSDKSNLKVLVFVHHWNAPHKTKIPYGAILTSIEAKEIILMVRLNLAEKRSFARLISALSPGRRRGRRK